MKLRKQLQFNSAEIKFRNKISRSIKYFKNFKAH